MGFVGSSSRACRFLASAGTAVSVACDIKLVRDSRLPLPPPLPPLTAVKPIVVVVDGARTSRASPTASRGRLLLGRLVFMLCSKKFAPEKHSDVKQKKKPHVEGCGSVLGLWMSAVGVFLLEQPIR